MPYQDKKSHERNARNSLRSVCCSSREWNWSKNDTTIQQKTKKNHFCRVFSPIVSGCHFCRDANCICLSSSSTLLRGSFLSKKKRGSTWKCRTTGKGSFYADLKISIICCLEIIRVSFIYMYLSQKTISNSILTFFASSLFLSHLTFSRNNDVELGNYTHFV